MRLIENINLTSVTIALALCLTSTANADRGCEGDLLMKVSYTERNSGVLKNTYLVGAITGGLSFPALGTQHLTDGLREVIADYPKELYLQDQLLQGNHFRQGEVETLEILPKESETMLQFEVVLYAQEPIGIEGIRRINVVTDFRLGCDTSRPIVVNREQFNAVRDGILREVTTRRTFQDFYGEYAVFYDVEYEVGGRSVTLTLPSPSNPAGC
jgi:hypothetical protein